MIRPSRIAALAFSTFALLACQGSELEPPAGSLDTSADTSDSSDTTDTSIDTEGDTSVSSSIAWWFHTDSGSLCLDVSTCEIFAEDELADQAASPGFQIDVEVELTGVAAGTEVVFTSGTDVLARGVAVIGGGGTTGVVFSAVTIPDVEGEQVLTVSTTDFSEAPISESKAVTTSFTPCEVTVEVASGADSCATVTSDNGDIGITATVTHTGGTCTEAFIDVARGGEDFSLVPVTLDENGQATFFIPLGLEGDTLQGPITLTAHVTHPTRDSLNGEATVEPVVDTQAPTITFTSPSEATELVTLADDADSDVTNGLQLAVTGSVDESNTSVAIVELFVDNISRGTALVDDDSNFELPAFTVTADGTYELKLVATDACGNAGEAVLSVPVRITPAEITITTPTDGASLKAVDDGDPGTAAVYETSFAVSVPGAADGATITVECSPDADPATWATVAETTVDGSALPTDDVFTFDGVALDTATLGNDAICRALVDLPNPGVSPEVGIRIGIPAPTLGALTSPTPNECLTSGVWTVSGTATGVDGQAVTVNVIDSSGAVAFTVTTGTVTNGEFTVMPNVGSLPDGAYAVSVDARDVYGNVVSETSSVPTVAVKLDRTAPVVEIQSPGATVDAAVTADADGDDTNGFQTDVTLHMTDASVAGGDLCLTANGADLGCKAVPDASGLATWTGVTLAPGGNTLVATGRDACGNSATSVTMVVTFLPTGPGFVSIVAPTDGATFLAVNDGDAGTALVYETDFTLDATGARDGAILAVECAAAGPSPSYTVVGSVTVDAATAPTDGLYTVPVAVDTAALGTDVVCRATNDLPQPGVSDVVALTFALPAPTLGTISAPPADQCVNTSPITVSGSATGLDGQPLTVTLTDAGGAEALTTTGGVIGAAAYDVSVDLGALADGAYTLGVDATDANGNVVSATSTTPTVAITVDRTMPSVAVVSPSGTLDPGNVAADADADGDPSNGYQHDVVVSLTDAGAVGGQVCLEANGASVGCQDVVTSGASVTFANVTLITGDNTFVVTGTDGCGNAADPGTGAVTLLSAIAPTVAISSPADGTTTASATTDVVVVVTDDGGAPVTGLGSAVTLTVNGADSGVTPTEPGTPDGTYTFSGVALSSGDNALVASATASGATGTSATVTVTRKTATPAIAIASPADGAVLSLASSECQAGVTDCVTDVSATTTDVEDGSTATLDVDCGGTASSFDGTVTSGAVSWSGVTLVDGEDCVLMATVTDAVGQVGTSADVTVTVDRTAPTIAITSPSGSQLLPSQDLSATDADLQFPLTVELSDIEAGQLVTVSLDRTAPDGATSSVTLTHTVATDTPAGSTYVATFEDAPGAGWVTFMDGSYVISASTSDAAGNVAGPVTTTVAVQTEEAVVRITQPNFLGDAFCDATTACTGTGVCNLADNRCYDRLGLNSVNTLFTTTDNLQTTTQNLRACSNATSLAGTGRAVCATTLNGGTFYEVARIDTPGGANGIALASALPDGYQTVVAEVQPIANGPWQRSVDDSQANGRYRRFFVDYTRPVVTGLTSPSDTLPPTNVLNIAEQAAPGRNYQIAFTSSEAGSAQVFVNSGAAVLTQSVTAGTQTTVTVPLAEGANTVWVVVTDANGNRSIAPPTAGAPTYSATVDTVAPSVAFVTPSTGTIRAGDDRDVVVNCSENGTNVTIRDGGADVATAACDGGQAVFAFTATPILTDGTHTLTAVHADTAGNTATAATNPASVLVDTSPPVGVIIAPADGSTFTDADDASSDAGYQIGVDFSTTGATTWRLWVAANCDASFNCDPATLRKSGSVTNPGGAEPTQLVTINIDATTTRRVLTLETEDAAGNVATTSVQLTFTLSDCTANFIDLPTSGWYNASACASGTSCASATVTITVRVVGACGSVASVELTNGGAPVGATAPDGSGDATFMLTVTDGQTLALEGTAVNGGGNTVASTGENDVSVDLSPPTVAFVAATVSSFQTAAAGASVTYNQALDLSPGTPGFQFHARVQVTDANVVGGAVTSVTATAGTTVALSPSNGPLPIALTGPSPATQDLLNMTLADGATHTVTVTARDAAGNTGTSSFTALVDITAPAAVPITDVGVISKRRARYRVRFTAVGDNGTTGAPVASYDYRYSLAPITEANFSSACSFLAPEIYVTRAIPTPGTPGITQEAQIGGPDIRPFTDPCKLAPPFEESTTASTDVAWYFAVRATDAAGNVSPLGASSTGTLTYAQAALETTRVTATSAVFPAQTVFWSVRGHVVGDVNNDGRADIIAGSEVVGGFCLIWGSTSLPKELTLSTVSGTTHTCMNDKAALAAAIFPGEVIRTFASRLRPAGDVNGDGVADFLVTGKFGNPPTGSTETGEAFALVYFGRTGGPDLMAPNVIIRGMQAGTSGAPYLGACSAGDFDGIANGTGLAGDLAVGEPTQNRVHVIPGNTAWTTSGRVTINVSNAGQRTANNVLTIQGDFAATGNAGALFGQQCGGAGDVLPTPSGSGAKDDLLVVQSGSADARIFVLPGREYTAGTTVHVTENVSDPGFGTSEDLISVRLRQESTGIKSGFGQAFFGNRDMTGDLIPDVVAACAPRSLDASTPGDGKSVYIFDGSKFAALVGQDVRVTVQGAMVRRTWLGTNGTILEASVNSEPGAIGPLGNFDGIVVGSPALPSIDIGIANINASHVELRMFQNFQVGTYGRYPNADGEFSNAYHPSGILPVGTFVDSGDVSGDGNIDIVTGGGAGDVLIIR
ncbi:MAG: hypothetical protein KC635_02300 [Myxococcales bacterium]|nr:hypothetical protein [Myxococcales bacterium]